MHGAPGGRAGITTTTPTPWPPEGGKPVYLAPSANAVERDVLLGAVRALAVGDGDPQLVFSGADAIAAADDPGRPIVPVRVHWSPAGGDGGPARLAGLREITRVAAPEALRLPRQRRVLSSDPSRCRVLVGAPATLTELEARWRERTGTPGKTTSDSSGPASSSTGDLPSFIERAAGIVLERAKRSVTGDRYRAPRGAVDEIIGDHRFQEAADALAVRLGRDPVGVIADARAYLEEFGTEQHSAARDVWARWSRFLHRAYDVKVDPEQVARIRELAAERPLVFLPSHRSNLDGFVMAALMYDQGLPPNNTLGGINMSFWPLGPMGRRNGVIFIRRTFRDNEVYRFALRQYLGFLVQKRFNLEWYIEGGRSRTGKLLPPRLGLFNYLADAVEDLGTDDLRVIPVSIVYDELREVHEMTSESRGAVKPAEGAKWLFDFARSQKGDYGSIHVNFGEPLDLAASLRRHGGLGKDVEPAAKRLARSKSSFEVMTRINRATAVTDTCLVTLALLAGEDRALTIGEVSDALEPLITYVHQRGIPGAESTDGLAVTSRVERTLKTLQEHGVVECFAGGRETVFRIGPDQELVAAFYRNAGIHWFINRAIVELALLHAAEAEPGEGDDPFDVAVEDAFRLRDLLKFEFFFPEKEEFLDELREEVALIDPRWRDRESRAELVPELGERFRDSGAVVAHRVLRSFVEAYAIVADHLAASGAKSVEVEDTIERCLLLGRQYRMQRYVTSEEALSSHLFRSALQLAKNRGLVDAPGDPDLAARRTAFADELADVLRRLRAVGRLDRQRSRPTGFADPETDRPGSADDPAGGVATVA
ncbi:glycerol-3-phosphate 1-O-acyltransferase [Patulibacter minatonensis]|uniref:glycerol-3-phosphate 1-O-acyltransferase n=1 Tax=Patulibacter minatonensis TaxID=298163 RepID=UPI0004BA7187|nr:glycerol-3-phosphate 1-O-acyltransferase [Patulibacter minatonensis]